MIPEHIIENTIGQMYGRGPARKYCLESIGYDYNKVQHAVNQRIADMCDRGVELQYVQHCVDKVKKLMCASM